MKFFRKNIKKEGWLAVNAGPDGYCIAQMTSKDTERPRLTSWQCGQKPRSAEEMERTIRELGMSARRCTTLLHPHEYQMLLIEAPNVQPDELKTAVRWRIKDLVDYPIDEATIDVLEVPRDREVQGRQHSMYAVAAPNTVILERMTAFQKARLDLAAIDIPEMAQRNLAGLVSPEERGVALLAFAPDSALLTITFRDALYLSRRIDFSFEQAERLPDEGRADLFDRVTLELQRSLDHCERQFGFIAVAKVVLGPHPQHGGLQDYLASNLYVPVERYDLTAVIDTSAYPDLVDPALQMASFHTLGAALRREGAAP